jgi:hypothetical protein
MHAKAWVIKQDVLGSGWIVTTHLEHVISASKLFLPFSDLMHRRHAYGLPSPQNILGKLF